MPKQKNDPVREAVLEVFEVTLDAQLRAVRRLRKGQQRPPSRPERGGMSQVELVEDILRRSGAELHITDILAEVARVHKIQLDRESVVSALTKKVQRGERFLRTGPNVFALKPGGGGR